MDLKASHTQVAINQSLSDNEKETKQFFYPHNQKIAFKNTENLLYLASREILRFYLKNNIIYLSFLLCLDNTAQI